MMGNDSIKRATVFRWNTKQELYDYFQVKYGLSKKDIDDEIQHAMQTFHLRKGQVIKTQELWQKVGYNLENNHMAKKLEQLIISSEKGQSTSDTEEFFKILDKSLENNPHGHLPPQPIIDNEE
jgi:hypothetical protein